MQIFTVLVNIISFFPEILIFMKERERGGETERERDAIFCLEQRYANSQQY